MVIKGVQIPECPDSVAGRLLASHQDGLPMRSDFTSSSPRRTGVELALRLIQRAFPLTIEARACQSDRVAKPHVTRIGVLSLMPGH
jgi:hypothetical protein